MERNNLRKSVVAFIGIFLILTVLPFVTAVFTDSNPQFSTFSSSGSYGEFDDSVCSNSRDFIVQISPTGCTPSVVTSDLLEDQDVTIFCPLSATQLNPSIKVEGIEDIGFSGEYPKEIRNIGFHPAQAALGVNQQTNYPVLENIGYLVINLRQQINESVMPDFIEGNLTARLKYDANNALGIGRTSFYLDEITDSEWQNQYTEYGFWEEKGYLRAEIVDDGMATISVYDSSLNKVSSFNLEEGEISEDAYIPGFDFCAATMNLKLNDVDVPDTRARLRINGDRIEVSEGEKFLSNRCEVRDLEEAGLVQRVKIQCREDDGVDTFELAIEPKVEIYTDGDGDVYSTGDVLYEWGTNSEKRIFLGYIGEDKSGRRFVVPVVSLARDKEEFLDSSAYKLTPAFVDSMLAGSNQGILTSAVLSVAKAAASPIAMTAQWLGTGAFPVGIYFIDEGSGSNIDLMSQFGVSIANLFSRTEGIVIPEIEFTRFATPQNVNLNLLDENIKENYQKSTEDYNVVVESFEGEKYPDDSQTTLGEEALYEQIILNFNLGQRETVRELCEDFEDSYSNSKKDLSDECNDDATLSSDQFSTNYVTINGRTSEIVFEDVYEPTLEDYSVEGTIRGTNGISRSFKLGKGQSLDLTEFAGSEGDVLEINSALYFRYINDKWQWSPDKENWVDVTEYITEEGFRDGESPSKNNLELIESLNGKSFEIGKRIILSRRPEGLDTIKLDSLQNGYAIFDVSGVNHDAFKELTYAPSSLRINVNDYHVFGNERYRIDVNKINLDRVAKVSVVPTISTVGSEADFNFKIGIEKRLIQLSPERINEKIENLNESIERFDNIYEGLNKTTTALGKACSTAGTIFSIKNLIQNLGGKGIARQTVMRGAGGWYEQCANRVSSGEYISQEQCLIKNSGEIDEDVNAMNEIIKIQNERIKEIESNYRDEKILSQDVIDTDAFMQDYSPSVQNSLGELGNSIANPNNPSETIDVQEARNYLSYDSWKNNNFNVNELRDIELYATIFASSTASANMKSIAQQRLYSGLSNVNANAEGLALAEDFASSSGLGNNNVFVGSLGDSDVRVIDVANPVLLRDSKYSAYAAGEGFDPYYVYGYKDSTTREEYGFVYDVDGVVVQTYSVDGNTFTIVNSENQNPFNVRFKLYDSESYNNEYKNPEVRYFETEPYKGMPAIVPFDTNDGWYVATKQTLPAGRNIEAFDASGRVNSFYLCNVGDNGLEEFNSANRDDVCQGINFGTGQPYNQFTGLDSTEATRLVREAREALESAARQHSSGVSRVSLDGIDGETYPVGEPAADIPDIQCQDFMSPSDCNIIFNLCDPVVCPSSRCDFGGAYPVRDVVQSGIVGSLALCLPNFREGIYLPVCMTGLQAGIDSWNNIQKDYRSCLQEQLETGRTTGICDEIQSIYMCEFFWEQAAPLADIALPNAIATLSGQNVRGGGEYMSVSNAWETAQQSSQYFGNYYRDSSLNAFNVKSTRDLGSEFCRNSLSLTVPTGVEVFSEIGDVRSPPQYYGKFDETTFSTATVPATSHYKVTYHISAGRSQGAYYNVYLKGGEESSFYQDVSSTRNVGSGYVEVGRSISESADFTAPSGYKQLCINVNGQEECGFKEVTTSFAFDYLEDQYLESQIDDADITTENQCVSGRMSIAGLLNTNIQQGVESLIDPEIYNQNIIRICATGNPGLGTDPNANGENSRWVDVGYCGNENMRCWLDTSSVEDILDTPNLTAYFTDGKTESLGEGVLEDLQKNYLSLLLNESNYLTSEEFANAVDEIEDASGIDRLNLIQNTLQNVFFNNEKAYLHLLRGGVYRELASELYRDFVDSMTDAELDDAGVTQKEYGAPMSDESEVVQGININRLSENQKAVFDATRELIGKSASRSRYENCWDAAYQAYRNAKVGDRCVYSDPDGKSYTIENEKGLANSERNVAITTEEYLSDESFPIFAVYSGSCNSVGNSNTPEEAKLSDLRTGDMLSYVWRDDVGHSAIFIRWIDEEEKTAYLFDWNGYDNSGNQVFRYFEEDLSDNKHPVYVYWSVADLSHRDIGEIINSIPSDGQEDFFSGVPVENEEGTKEVGEACQNNNECESRLCEYNSQKGYPVCIMNSDNLQDEDFETIEEIFELGGGAIGYNIVYKYEEEDNSWYWTRKSISGMEDWVKVPGTELVSSESIPSTSFYVPQPDFNVVEELLGKSYEEGISILIDEAIERGAKLTRNNIEMSTEIDENANPYYLFHISFKGFENDLTPAFSIKDNKWMLYTNNAQYETVEMGFTQRGLTDFKDLNEAKLSSTLINLIDALDDSSFDNGALLILTNDDYKDAQELDKADDASGEATEILFDYPIFEYRDGRVAENLFYSYANGWQWSRNEGDGWKPVINIDSEEISEENKDFIQSLQEKNYNEGFELFIQRTVTGRGGWLGLVRPKLSTESAEMSNDRNFVFDYADNNGLKRAVDFRYYQNTWQWKSDEIAQWTNVPETFNNGAYYGEPVGTIKALEGKDFYDGAMILFEGKNPNFSASSEQDLDSSLLEKYASFSSVFEEYSEANLPLSWEQSNFKALLVAIAHYETNLEDERWLMGYSRENYAYVGADEQVKRSSAILKSAIEGRAGGLYEGCFGNDRISCILSVYLTGDRNLGRTTNEEGKIPVNEVLEYWGYWRNYFNS